MTQSISDIEKCLRIRISSGSQQNSSHYSQYMSFTKLQSRPRKASASADSLNFCDHQSCYYHLETRDRRTVRPLSLRQNQERNKKCVNGNSTSSYRKREEPCRPYNFDYGSAAEHFRGCSEFNLTPNEKYLSLSSKHRINKLTRFNMAYDEKQGPGGKTSPGPGVFDNYSFNTYGNYNPPPNGNTPPTTSGYQPNFQNHSMPFSRDHCDHIRTGRMEMCSFTFTSIMSSLATQIVKVVYAMLLMFMQLVPVVEVFGNIIHFAVDHICDIRHTNNNQDMMMKTAIFIIQILTMVCGVLFVVCAILLPVSSLILCVVRRFFFFI